MQIFSNYASFTKTYTATQVPQTKEPEPPKPFPLLTAEWHKDLTKEAKETLLKGIASDPGNKNYPSLTGFPTTGTWKKTMTLVENGSETKYTNGQWGIEFDNNTDPDKTIGIITYSNDKADHSWYFDLTTGKLSGAKSKVSR
jgi:hypothetical protein